MINRTLCCKIEIIWVKYVPILISLVITLNNFFYIDSPELSTLDYLCLPSLVTVVHFYILRRIIGLCRFHRLFIDYILCNVLCRIFRYTFDFHSKAMWHYIYSLIFVLFVFLISAQYVTDYKKTTS